ncbi:MAG: TlpA family protein disulfide reductase [Gammaproteobacteria bacterium]|nr:TlpA family protein disulfide reductase [Gammaproteobacteria bacterium]
MSRNFLIVLMLLTGMSVYSAVAIGTEEPITTSEGDEIPIEVYGRSTSVRLLWFPSETGLKMEDQQLAVQLAKQGVEVWLVDLFAARFLPLAPSSMESMPALDVARVIKAASKDKAQVYLLAPGRGAVPVLRGAREWQQQQGQLAGIILLHPKLYEETPNPGEPARLLPILKLTNQAIYLLQPELSPVRWRLTEMMSALHDGGSDAFTQRLPQVRDRFWFRADADDYENRLTKQLPQRLLKAMLRLQYVEKNRFAPMGEISRRKPGPGKKERSLSPYAGSPQPPPLQLQQYQGAVRSLVAEQGKVVLVNFWATWCPPCVHEMPSMQGLYQDLKPQGLEILAVNMAESEVQIEMFLQTRGAVDFPVLLDRDGAALRRWDVFAFPTSFVIDRQGHVRYALFGAVDWQNAEIKSQLERLLKEK